MKICTKCKQRKDLSKFHKNKRGTQGRESICKICRSQHMKRYYIDNKDRIKASAEKFQQDNPDYRHEHYISNLERVKKQNEEWRKKNKHKCNVILARRRARKLNATPAWANRTEIETIYKQAQKMTQETGILHEVDHIVPLQGKNVCGLHVEVNLQILTKSENCRKGNSF
jgi:hypothetical protein